MPLLIGYLVALSVFIGGGYAGVRWLAYPDPSAPPVARVASKTTPAKPAAAKPDPEPARETEQASQLDTVAEASSNPNKPAVETAAVAPTPSETLAPATTEPAQSIADVDAAASVQGRNTEVPRSETVAADGPAAAPAAAAPADVSTTANAGTTAADASPETAKPAAPEARPSPSTPAKIADPAPPASSRDAARAKAKPTPARAKIRTAARQPSPPSRKPVMMVMRTIEFADGRREVRLLPMPRYGRASAFAAEPDFDDDDD